ncbi:hypothetical protein Pelo_14628 [Pelomyxa schiedti]|nr:hypothetical protein Pelo_14628 [Pelomyxa schiedti]
MVDPFSASVSTLMLTLQAAAYIKKLYDANAMVPQAIVELETTVSSINDILGPVRTATPALTTVVNMINDECVVANRLMDKLKSNKRKLFFNPQGTVAEINQNTTRLKEHLGLLTQAINLAGAFNLNSSKILTDPATRTFWATCFGETTLCVPYNTFVDALGAHAHLSTAQIAIMGKKDGIFVDVHQLQEVTAKPMLEGLISLMSYRNPFELGQVVPVKAFPVVVNPESVQQITAEMEAQGRKATYQPLSADKANPANKYFVIACEAGGVLDVFGGEQANRPGCSIVCAPFNPDSRTQKWKFDKYGCICNLDSGLVLDVNMKNLKPNQIPPLIQWARHGGPNQKWKLCLDRTLRVAALPGMCLDVDVHTKKPCPGGFLHPVGVYRYNSTIAKPNQMFRLVSAERTSP